jgi:hypothetical protein
LHKRVRKPLEVKELNEVEELKEQQREAPFAKSALGKVARTSWGILPCRYCLCQEINWKWLMEKGIERGRLNGGWENRQNLHASSLSRATRQDRTCLGQSRKAALSKTKYCGIPTSWAS